MRLATVLAVMAVLSTGGDGLGGTIVLGDTAPMTAARWIGSDSELNEIAAAGVGFVIDPLNHRSVANCPRVLAMTVGERKWFAPSAAAVDAYLRQRLAQYPIAMPIEPCG